MAEIRYALRRVSRSRGHFVVASLLIAIGMAAIVQIFSLTNALLLRPLPVHTPENLIQLFDQQPKRPADPFFDYPFFRELSHHSSTLSDVIGQFDTARLLEYNQHSERIHDLAVTENYFSVLGIIPALGHFFGTGGTHVAVLSHSFWETRFQRDPKVLGQVLYLQGHPYTIIGITPKDFTGTTIDLSPDVWTPYSDLPEFSHRPNATLDQFVIELIARLRPNVTAKQARLEVSTLWNRHMDATRDPNDQYGLTRGQLEIYSITHGVSPVRDQSGTALSALLAGTGVLLLIVCANVGGLMLSQAAAAEKETAIRLALGASQARIVRQWLVDSFFLTLAGASLGLLLAYAGMPLLVRWLPPAHGNGFDPAELRTLTLNPSLDLRVVAFCLAVCLITTAACALAPAWKSARSDVNSALKATLSDKRHRVFQSVLSVLQVALCTALLICAGLVLRSLANLRSLDPGFDKDHIALFTINTAIAGYNSTNTWLLQQRLLDSVRSLPGVEAAAFADRGLMRGIGYGTSVVFPGDQSGGVINTSTNTVTPGYFAVMRLRFISGRDFTPSDSVGKSNSDKVVVNQAFARKFLYGKPVIGAKFATGKRFVAPDFEIIGIVNDSKYRSLREIPPPTFYICSYGPKAYWDSFILHVRTKGDPHAITDSVRHLLNSIDPKVPLYAATTLAEEVDRSLWQERMLAALMSCFGAFALAVSLIAIYGILACFVAYRKRELALRLALGANRTHTISLLARRIIPVLASGIIAGIALSIPLATWSRNLLYEIHPFDPVTALIVTLLTLATGIAATIRPLRRTLRLDPAQSLRQE